jgi:hypothetical protein
VELGVQREGPTQKRCLWCPLVCVVQRRASCRTFSKGGKQHVYSARPTHNEQELRCGIRKPTWPRHAITSTGLAHYTKFSAILHHCFSKPPTRIRVPIISAS